MISETELRIVATAIADANRKESGADWFDYLDPARSCIAAFDALIKHREALALEKNKAIVEGIKKLSKATPDPELIAMAAEGAPAVVTPLATLANPENTGSATPAIQTPTATVTSIRSAKGKGRANEKVPSL